MSIKQLFEGDQKRVNRLLSDTGSVTIEQAVKALKDQAQTECSIPKLKQLKSDIMFLWSYNHYRSVKQDAHDKKVRKLREEIWGL